MNAATPPATLSRIEPSQSPAGPTVAAANAAAASFAALTENLGYLDAASIEQVRQASLVVAALARRGFAYPVIKEAIRRVEEDG